MLSCPPTRPHQGSCVIQASLRCPNRVPLGNPSGSRACCQRQTRALPGTGNALQGTSSCFSLKNTQAAVPQPYYLWTSLLTASQLFQLERSSLCSVPAGAGGYAAPRAPAHSAAGSSLWLPLPSAHSCALPTSRNTLLGPAQAG